MLKSAAYKPVHGDLLDEMLGQYINKSGCPVPIKKLGDGYYLFGTKKIFAKILNGKLVIRVGGGYMVIEEFISTYAEKEMIKLDQQEGRAQAQMQKSNSIRMTNKERSPQPGARASTAGGDQVFYQQPSPRISGTYHKKRLTAAQMNQINQLRSSNSGSYHEIKP